MPDPVFRSPFQFWCYFSKRHFLLIIFRYYHFFERSHLRIINTKLISPSTPARYCIPISKSIRLHLLWYIWPVSPTILLIYFEKGLVFLLGIKMMKFWINVLTSLVHLLYLFLFLDWKSLRSWCSMIWISELFSDSFYSSFKNTSVMFYCWSIITFPLTERCKIFRSWEFLMVFYCLLVLEVIYVSLKSSENLYAMDESFLSSSICILRCYW